MVEKRFTTLATLFDVESLSHLCRLLYTYEAVLDILAIHVKICDIVFCALHFLEQYDYETVGRNWMLPIDLAYIDVFSGDPQTAVTHLGDVVLFVQYTISRFHVRIKSGFILILTVCSARISRFHIERENTLCKLPYHK